jgi:hypothetical protein
MGVNILGVTSLDNAYSSKFNTAEVSGLLHVTPRIDVLAGMRWVEIGEQLGMNFNNGVLVVQSNTASRGYGPQLGVRLRVIDNDQFIPVTARIEGKVAYVRLENSVATLANGIFANVQADNTNWTTLSEVGGTVALGITKGLALEFGGKVIYLNSVPTAITGPGPEAPVSVPTNTTYLLYGATAGLRGKF